MNNKNLKYNIGELAASASISNEKAEELRETARNRKKALIKLGAMMILILIMIIFGTISWFTMNTQVGSSGMGISTSTLPFILKTKGYYGYYDDRLPEEYKKLYDDQATAGYPNNNNSGTLTTADGTSIQWLITSDYNTKNYVLSTSDDDDKGIRPGSGGEMKFWIASKGNSSVRVSFKIDIKPYITEYQLKPKENDEDPDEIYINPDTKQPVETGVVSIAGNSEYADIESYIKSHIVFFKKRTPHYKTVEDQEEQVLDYYTYSDLIPISENFNLVYDDVNDEYINTLDFTFDNENNEYKDEPFSIYWVWPETLAEAVLPDGKHHALCSDNEILEKLIENPSQYLKDYTSADVDNNELNADTITRYYSKLSLKYNNADQDIGDTIGYLLLELSAIG
ncbi:hypothetical protein [Ruminococcus sp.]|uniref:hypothetical protein n=1 Tax=Ruminococcus sp. TaxID=41978 RepID=UPI00258ACB56|nr:hypothetical protein [Ruminococcus sp.]MCR5021792.1 hypothetical protein [Ruminococcus sp.]